MDPQGANIKAPNIKAKPGKATEEMDLPLSGRIGSVRLRIGRLGRSEEKLTSRSGWIEAEEEEGGISAGFKE